MKKLVQCFLDLFGLEIKQKTPNPDPNPEKSYEKSYEIYQEQFYKIKRRMFRISVIYLPALAVLLWQYNESLCMVIICITFSIPFFPMEWYSKRLRKLSRELDD